MGRKFQMGSNTNFSSQPEYSSSKNFTLRTSTDQRRTWTGQFHYVLVCKNAKNGIAFFFLRDLFLLWKTQQVKKPQQTNPETKDWKGLKHSLGGIFIYLWTKVSTLSLTKKALFNAFCVPGTLSEKAGEQKASITDCIWWALRKTRA